MLLRYWWWFIINWITWWSQSTCSAKYQLSGTCEVKLSHQRRPEFPSATPGCSGRLWRIWRNLVPSDGELHTTRRSGDGLRCTCTSLTCWWRIRTIRMTCVLHFSQWPQLCWSRFFSGRRFFGNAAGAPGNHSYYLSFNDFQNLGIQFVVSSMYLCIDIATYLHMVYLDWQHAVIVLRYPCISVHPPSLINHVPRGCDWASWELHLEAEIEWTHRCTGRSGSSELRDALRGRDRANLEAVIERVWRYTWRRWLSEFEDALGGRDHAKLKAVIDRVWIYTWMPWSSEIGRVLAGSRWTARLVLRLYSSVS